MKRIFELWKAEGCHNCKVLYALIKQLKKDFDFELRIKNLEELSIPDRLMLGVASPPGLFELVPSSTQSDRFRIERRKISIEYNIDSLTQNMGLKPDSNFIISKKIRGDQIW